MDYQEARMEAYKIVRFKLGNIPQPGEAEFDLHNYEYVFPIKVVYPHVVRIGEVNYYHLGQVGEVRIPFDAKGKEDIEWTDVETVDERISTRLAEAKEE